MHFSPETQNEFIKNHLGPKLQASDHDDIKLLIYDQNRDGLEHWTDTILAGPGDGAVRLWHRGALVREHLQSLRRGVG